MRNHLTLAPIFVLLLLVSCSHAPVPSLEPIALVDLPPGTSHSGKLSVSQMWLEGDSLSDYTFSVHHQERLIKKVHLNWRTMYRHPLRFQTYLAASMMVLEKPKIRVHGGFSLSDFYILIPLWSGVHTGFSVGSERLYIHYGYNYYSGGSSTWKDKPVEEIAISAGTAFRRKLSLHPQITYTIPNSPGQPNRTMLSLTMTFPTGQSIFD